MRSITAFKNLTNEKELCEIRIAGLIERKEVLLKLVKAPASVNAISYSGMPSAQGSPYNLEKLCNELTTINNELHLEYTILATIENTQTQYREKLKACKGTAYEIGYLRLIEHKTYREIANELNMAEAYVRRIGANILKDD